MIENFGQNIKRLRQKHQITQEDLAIAIEVQKQAISNIERGKSYPSFENLDRIARFSMFPPSTYLAHRLKLKSVALLLFLIALMNILTKLSTSFA